MTPQTCQYVSFLGYQWAVSALPLIGALLGAIVGVFATGVFNRFVLSGKDKNEVAQQRFKNSTELLADQTAKRNEFESVLTKVSRKKRFSLNDVVAIMKSGDDYFDTMRAMAHAVLEKRVSDSTRKDFVAKIAGTLEKSIPQYYAAISNISAKTQLSYSGKFEEGNYDSLFKVLDRHDPAAASRARAKLASQ